jgi:glucose/arabinose dehydrogenase
MRSFVSLLLGVLVAGCSTSLAAPASSVPTSASSSSPLVSSASLVGIGAGLLGPAGVAATVDATGLQNVAALAFDADGRLWAATAGFEDGGTDAVYRIGAPRVAPVPVITGLHTPLGLLWLDGSLYVASTGEVVAYSGLTGDTFTRHRTVVTLPEGTGEVNELALEPDGRLVLGISAPCDACTPSSRDAAAVVSFEPDGSDVRVVASGIRAPVGLAYRSDGDLFVTMNQRDDLGDATPGDWLSIVRSGQDWGFPGCYGQDSAACADDPSPVAVLDPHAAVSGVAIVEGRFGPVAGAAAFVAEWAKGVVLRIALSKDADGNTTGSVEPFLAGLQSPVPIITAPDGTLLVGDWKSGTVYRIAPA